MVHLDKKVLRVDGLFIRLLINALKNTERRINKLTQSIKSICTLLLLFVLSQDQQTLTATKTNV